MELQTVLGKLRVRWGVVEETLTVEAEIPPGVTGALRLPGGTELALQPSHISVSMPFVRGELEPVEDPAPV